MKKIFEKIKELFDKHGSVLSDYIVEHDIVNINNVLKSLDNENKKIEKVLDELEDENFCLKMLDYSLEVNDKEAIKIYIEKLNKHRAF